nr:unnamed protein product [Callosobruchus chinensis]
MCALLHSDNISAKLQKKNLLTTVNCKKISLIVFFVSGLTKIIKIIIFIEYAFRCDNCSKSYKHRRNLHRHVKFECNQLPAFFCPTCGKRFRHKHHLQHHALLTCKGIKL